MRECRTLRQKCKGIVLRSEDDIQPSARSLPPGSSTNPLGGRRYLEFAVQDNMDWLLEQMNTGFDEAWPYISKVVDKPKKKERARVQVGMDSDVRCLC